MKKWSRHLLAAGALALGMSAAHADDNNTLYFYNWTEYVPPGLLEQFTKETGIKVIYSTYESNETMYSGFHRSAQLVTDFGSTASPLTPIAVAPQIYGME